MDIDQTLCDYRRGIDSGTMKSATPNVVRQLLDEIDRLRTEVAKLEPYRAAQESYDSDNAYRGEIQRQLIAAQKLGVVLPTPTEPDEGE